MFERIKQAFLAPFADPDWATTSIRQGVWLLVPLVGYVALLGWQRAAFEAARRGEQRLPPPGFGEYLKQGWPTFWAVVLMYAVPVVLFSLLVELPAQVLHLRVGAYVPQEIFQFPGVALVFLAYVEVLRRALVGGESASILRPGPSLRAIRKNPGAYFAIALAMVVAYIGASIGLYACCVGAIFTGPLGHAVAARLVLIWEQELNAPAAPTAPSAQA